MKVKVTVTLKLYMKVPIELIFAIVALNIKFIAFKLFVEKINVFEN